jgi:hypothetical protein
MGVHLGVWVFILTLSQIWGRDKKHLSRFKGRWK